MGTTSNKANQLIDFLRKGGDLSGLLHQLRPRTAEDIPNPPEMPGSLSWSEASRSRRLEVLETQLHTTFPNLSGMVAPVHAEELKGNIENFIGYTRLPTGIAGPLLINGTLAQGDFYVPMATTEGALVASYSRGARATRSCGGITSVCTTEGVQRTPVWKFEHLREVGVFIEWLLTQMEVFRAITRQHSNYAQLTELKLNMEGNQVLTLFEFVCGEAAGQNMATICTEAICLHIIANGPVQPRYWFIESNYSGDKKATALSFSTVRGKKVTAEAFISREACATFLHTTPEQVSAYWQASVVAASQSGSIGIQGHFANGLAALFIATGQDAACVAEAHVGVTRLEVHSDGSLYASVTLPALVVGTVGGGTGLPTQQECLRMLQCSGPGSARKLAEICGALALAGEVSIAAALASGEFSKAHRIFRRKKNG